MEEVYYSQSISYLPLPVNHQYHENYMSAARKFWRYVHRILKYDQMDFEFAFWQMINLFTVPQKVYQNFQHRKQSKFQFARDDPAFLVLFTGCLIVTSIAFALVAGFDFWKFLFFLLYVVFITCIGSGILIATVLWYMLNQYFRLNKDQNVEWGFAFDVHLNALFPPVLILQFNQLFLYNNLLGSDRWFFRTCIGNTFWLIAAMYYVYITFLGYRSLQILQRTYLLLTPVLAIVLFYITSLVVNYDITYSLLIFYNTQITY